MSKVSPSIPVKLLVNIAVVVVKLNESKVNVSISQGITNRGIRIETLRSSGNVVILSTLREQSSQFGGQSSVTLWIVVFDIEIEPIDHCRVERSLNAISRAFTKSVPKGSSKVFGLFIIGKSIRTDGTTHG